jgi:hypothetical protein
MTSGIDLARELIAAGIPVVVCTPRPGWKPGDARLDIVTPTGWSVITAAECDVSGFRPGVDTLAMVGGYGVDVVDCDTKAPGFGSLDNMPPFRRFGRTGTPSGGTHDYVRSTGIAKISPLTTSAGHVGDYVGGTPEGGGRLLAFLPGSTRPKYPGLTYTVIEPLRLEELLENDPDDDLMNVLMAHGGNRAGLPGKPSASLTATRTFLAEHSTAPEHRCSYGKAAIAGMLKAATATTPGDPKAGRHGWAVASATRCVELVRAGCAWSADLDLLEATLHQIKPEGGSDWGGILAWAINNATGTVACGMHNPAPKVDTTAAPFGAIESVDAPTVPAVTLADAHKVFTRWLGKDYDLDAMDAMLAAAAVERLDGDPIWLLIISGSGNAKTETVQALDGIHAIITSTISSEGALLSATSAKEKAKDATGGLLRKIGGRGILVIKDVTSVLSMGRDQRAMVLGALREVYDGRWSRNVGTDGGRTLEWSGRIVCIGAVTTKWDQAHDVIAAMGDRFVLLRMDSTKGRQVAGRKAIGNTGSEIQMRAELAAAAAGVMAGMNPEVITITDAETDVLLAAADVVTLARTGVEYDYRGDVIDAHAPEMPTRFAKQLAQVVRGGVAIGMSRPDALRLAIRCARDSMPPLRLTILDDVATHPGSKTAEVRKRLGKPRATVDRQLQALNMLGVLDVQEDESEWRGQPATVWRYEIAEGIDPKALSVKSVPDLSVPTPSPQREKGVEDKTVCLPTDLSGTDCEICHHPLADQLIADGIRRHVGCAA